ncbi:starch synthase [Loktanella fryxellensis]|uniref:Glycogen synthase n=1 Tax=Loktanella fryxellensis TaxID=245187 RepID=A0A1H8G9L5_9RHOB|nr:glycogen synthase GlgA [Loktanella fryxellensis]SEN39978.1 starch synthase [Loktanella fryxellensis]
MAVPDRMGRVLSVTSEMVPLIKTGGLADVAGALPAALSPHGWKVVTLLPAYPGVAAKVGRTEVVWSDPALFGGPVQVLRGMVGAATVLLLDAPHLYDRAGTPYGSPQDFPDNPQRFAALSWVASRIAREGLTDGWRPDVLHGHDWQAGFAPAYLRYGGETPVKSVMTIHNIAFKGMAPAAMLGGLRLPFEGFNANELEFWGQLSSLKAGLALADAITTVSPTYAAELMRHEFGMGLEGLLAHRAADLHGILNGVDEAVWNPETDPAIKPFGRAKLAARRANKLALLAEFGLTDAGGPLAIVVSRLTDQKGIDLLTACAADFVAQGGTLAVLGAGEPHLEEAMKDLVKAHPGRIGLRLGYDEALSHRMFAGGDAVLVPSRFEPCGLTQMYGLRYGCVPVVALTGGLADTVIDANPMAVQAQVATGIQFHPVDALAFAQALRRLHDLYADPKGWALMQKRGMAQALGWDTSGSTYAKLYESLTA